MKDLSLQAKKICETIHEQHDMLERVAKYVQEMTETKAALRLALNEAGFSIPDGLKFSEWIPIIKEVAGRERTV